MICIRVFFFIFFHFKINYENKTKCEANVLLQYMNDILLLLCFLFYDFIYYIH